MVLLRRQLPFCPSNRGLHQPRLSLPCDRPKGNAAAKSGAGSAGTCDSGTAPSTSAADGAGGSGQPRSGDANSSGGDAAASAAEQAAEAAGQPARSRRSESAPLVKRPTDLAAADARHESPFSGDGRRGRRSLDLKPLSDNKAGRPGELEILQHCSLRRCTTPGWFSRPTMYQPGKRSSAARTELLAVLWSASLLLQPRRRREAEEGVPGPRHHGRAADDRGHQVQRGAAAGGAAGDLRVDDVM